MMSFVWEVWGMLCLEKLLGLLKNQRKSNAYKKRPWKSQRYTVTGNRYCGEGVCWDDAQGTLVPHLDGVRYVSFQVSGNRRMRELLCTLMVCQFCPLSLFIFCHFCSPVQRCPPDSWAIVTNSKMGKTKVSGLHQNIPFSALSFENFGIWLCDILANASQSKGFSKSPQVSSSNQIVSLVVFCANKA